MAQTWRRACYLSLCGRYRYALAEIWQPSEPLVNWILLNPSKADERIDDPTFTRVRRRSKDLGYGGLVVTNLFAWRATQPAELCEVGERDGAPAVIGGENDAALRSVAACASLIVLGWGACPFRWRAHAVLELLKADGRTLHCLKQTSDGSPGHPLYLPMSLTPQPFDERVD